MLTLFTLIVILVVAGSQYRNGIFTSVTMLIQVLFAGLVAFGFWEPVADELDAFFRDGKFVGYEDCIALVGLFTLAVFGMRQVTNRINKGLLDFNFKAQQIAAPAVGLLTGYLVSGFLVCVMQTLPLDEEFFGFKPRRADEPSLRSYIPADRVWLALMRRAGAYPFSWTEDNPDGETLFDRCATFDRAGTFEMRYARYRRHTERRPAPLPYQGEFERELRRAK